MSDSNKNQGLSPLVRGLMCVAIGAIIWFIPAPAGVGPQAWGLLAVFMATIAFLGLGQMGSPMANNLLQKGHSLQVFDVNAQAVDALVTQWPPA